jgi:hypothetical protein
MHRVYKIFRSNSMAILTSNKQKNKNKNITYNL